MMTLVAAICLNILVVDPANTLLLKEPALSAKHIAFIYADDLWICNRDGSHARRITASSGVEGLPVFSPDGQWIAFSGEYDGNQDVYLVSIMGGNPQRLTWHPADDLVVGFMPDGKGVMFNSRRDVHTRRFSKLFQVSVTGGMPQPLPVPSGFRASMDPSGKFLAYTPVREVFWQWKNYRGGTHGRIWVMDMTTQDVVEIPQGGSRCNDTFPVWVGDSVFFISDRQGEFNLFEYHSGEVRQVTHFDDFPILSLNSSGTDLIFEQGGHLHLYVVESDQQQTLSIATGADLIATRPRFEDAGSMIRSAAVSPSGVRAVFEARGEIITVPAEKGDPRNLTLSSGAHDRTPAWSPDGQHIAYVSDASGEYQLAIQEHNGLGSPRYLHLEGTGFYFDLKWSPDSLKIAYRDNSQSLYLVDVESGSCTFIDTEPYYGPFVSMTYDWSPDSKWLTYTINTHGLINDVYVFDLTAKKRHKLTDGLSDVRDPVFDASGKYLYFLASTDAGPIKDWFAMSNNDRLSTYAFYAAVLAADTPSPLAPESDEEQAPKDDQEKQDDKEVKTTRIDFDGLDQRIIALPIPNGSYQNLHALAEGSIIFLENDPLNGFAGNGNGGKIMSFSFEKGKTEELTSGAFSFAVSANRKKLLVASGSARNPQWSISDVTKYDPKSLNTSLQVKVDPTAEWQQIYDEAWRINRDYFYATNYHGADWPAMKAKYQPFVEHVAVRSDLNRIIQWLCSELAVGHHGVGGGDDISDPESVPMGLLGADFSVDQGRYRFDRVYGGLNWNPDLKSPLAVPGVLVKDGEYLLAVNDREVVPPENLYMFFEHTVGKQVRLRVAANADGSGARDVVVEPIADESALRNRAWVEDNIRKVDEATDGRVAYVWLPNTTTRGHTYFKRYFYPQAHKQAIILDERYNGGGQIADYYIDVMRRKPVSYWATRYGKDLFTPTGSIQGPKVMLIDENAGSGGDLLPWMFRKYDMGPLIGKATWGGLVGTLGFPTLMDGGRVTAPNLAIFTEEGWVVENVGVPPDIEVEQWPKLVNQGRDPQLEKAIEVVLEGLAKNPPKTLERPPYPVRVRQ